MKSKATADASAIFERILESLGAKNAPEVAKILGLSKQSVYDWRESTPSIDNLLRISQSGNASLHWLLTGEGDQRINSARAIGIEEVLELKIRSIVRDELSLFGPQVQDLGNVDEFDLEESIKRLDNPGLVLQEWYRHEGLPVENISVPIFKQWDRMTLEEKVQELKGFRSVKQRQKERSKNALSPKPPSSTK